MKLKVDENLPVEVAAVLRQAGHDASTVFTEHLTGSGDPNIATVCRTEARALITLDMDFADIRPYPPAQYAGLVVLRLRRQDKPHVLETIRRLLPAMAAEQLEQRLWIVEEARLRVRE
jgi:predicted nuclease of predicted toxin-antitoxin system